MKQQNITTPVKEEGYTKGKLYLLNDEDIVTDTPNGQDSNGYVATVNKSLYTVPGRQQANAARIVLAWNGWDKLKEENTRLLEDKKELIEALKELFECDYTSGTHLYIAQLKAKEAIQKHSIK